MPFWVNDGHDEPGNGTTLDKDLQVLPNTYGNANGQVQPNYTYGQITCQRDLENLARLWVCGLPNLPTNQGYTVTLSLDNDSPINLYPAYEFDGGTSYLTDTNVAAMQISSPYGTNLAQLTYFTNYTLPVDGSGNPLMTHFLFEGAASPPYTDGTGMNGIVLTISQNGQPIAQTTAYVNFSRAEDMYETALVTNVIQTWPEMVQQTNVSGFEVQSTPGFNPDETNQLAVFVHGWRMTDWDWQDFSDTMFKRLYWQGYQGRFASLRWPTRSADTDTNNIFTIPADLLTFNRSEHIAFESGTGAAAYLNNLRSRYTNYTISVAAHSMGNIVMMEALKELAASNEAPIDNYVMMQAAVAAQCYDTTISNLPSMLDAEADIPTPNSYANYAVGITNAVRHDIINFYNTNDFALAKGATTLFTLPYFSSISFNTSWEGNESQIFIKPLILFGYQYNPTNGIALNTTNFFTIIGGVTNLQTRVVTDPRELMPYVARPRSKAAGAQSGVGQTVNGGEFNLSTVGFTEADYDHSGEFKRNIQDPVVQLFYPQLRSKLFPSQ
jgi:pimeloyl-ACP methyl ester carboxylesterase